MHGLPVKVKEKYLESGQALLIVLLVMAVVLTVSLSFVSRSVVDIKTTGLEEDSLRAFSAAETGIERSLLTQSVETGTVSTSPSVSFTATPITAASGNSFLYPRPLLSGEEATIWFVGHNAANKITCTSDTDLNCTRRKKFDVCWGNGVGTTPAVEVSVYYDPTQDSFDGSNTYANLNVLKFNFDPDDSGRRTINKFVDEDNGPACLDLNYGADITLGNICNGNTQDPGQTNCLVMAKIRMLYNTVAQRVGIKLTGNASHGNNQQLPSQGFQVESVGVSNDVQRNLNVFRSYPVPQSIFSAAVFSRNSLTKP